MDYKPIEDYGVIGDLHTVALVGVDGSIDFMCFPSFDSPTVFAALLDHRRGGRFQIAPVLRVERSKQFYLPNTNVLLTRFFSRDGVAELCDFMPVEAVGSAQRLVRTVKSVRGEIRFRMVCAPRFNYGRASHTIVAKDDSVIFIPDKPGIPALRLRTFCPVACEGDAGVCEFTLKGSEEASFVLEEVRDDEPSPSESTAYVSEAFRSTVGYWRSWIAQSTYRGRWREMVNRSAFLLKMLISEEYGSIIAAPTFGLPEEIGGVRNWDYRYTWVRDASFTIYALTRLGLVGEAERFFKWIEERCKHLNPRSPLHLVYGLNGRSELPEFTLDGFEGYKLSAPVRVGNAAQDQLQLDTYGALIDSIFLYDKHGKAIHHELWQDLARVTEWVCDNWRLADESIWEVRGGKKEFLYSRVMCWVALDRAIRISAERSFPAPIAKWTGVRDDIYVDVFKNFWDGERGAFVQHKGTKAVDASTLIMPLVKFTSPTDPQWLSTLRVIERDLLEDSLVYRYRLGTGEGDGLPGSEGTFSMCTFWYVECLSRAGDLEQARLCFEKMLGHANHLGLYAEQLGPCGEHLGNFPQALTHVALISAACDLNRRLDAAERRA
jgi:GH15 family glucan-1,4-alpha-glucosidase